MFSALLEGIVSRAPRRRRSTVGYELARHDVLPSNIVVPPSEVTGQRGAVYDRRPVQLWLPEQQFERHLPQMPPPTHGFECTVKRLEFRFRKVHGVRVYHAVVYGRYQCLKCKDDGVSSKLNGLDPRVLALPPHIRASLDMLISRKTLLTTELVDLIVQLRSHSVSGLGIANILMETRINHYLRLKTSHNTTCG